MMPPPTVLTIDDNLAAEATETDYFYDRGAFLEDNHESGVDFLFCSAWDEGRHRYSAEAAFDHLEGLEHKPSVILLDVRFGSQELLGLEILKGLSQRFAAIPVIVMTSTAKEELWEKCMVLGAVDYLVKPIRPENTSPNRDPLRRSQPAVLAGRAKRELHRGRRSGRTGLRRRDVFSTLDRSVWNG